MTYFSIQIKTNKTRKELYQSLYGLIQEKENSYFPVYPFCFFDSEYYKNIKKKMKSPYSGEIKNNEFIFKRTIFINYFRQLKIVGKINSENDNVNVLLNFQMNTITVMLYLALLVFGIWEYISKNDPIILVFIIFLVIEYLIVLYNYLKIRVSITS